MVSGANFYYDSLTAATRKDKHVAGLEVIDDSTFSITLNRPFAGFLYRLAMPFTAVFPHEAVEKYGTDMREVAVGTGPFRLKKVLPDVGVFMVRNEHYWGIDSFGNQLPYLDGVKVTFIKEEKVEMLEFKKGNLELKYRLPIDMVQEIIDSNAQLLPAYSQFVLQNVKELSSQYYGFLTIDPLMKDVHIRRAFNYAIDRDKLVKYTLKNEGTPNNFGIVPKGLPGYDHSQLKRNGDGGLSSRKKFPENNAANQ
jgi:peptide/nickel transport system substrate-binding protein